MSINTFTDITYIWVLIPLIIFILLLFVNAPYGRYISNKWGLLINNKIGWFLMELPALAVFVFFFLFKSEQKNVVVWLFFAFWTFHYSYRSLLYPFITRTSSKKIPFLIVLFAIFFNSVNGFLNGYYFSHIKPFYEISWLWDIRFISGTLMFFIGMIINRSADKYLISLRKPGETGYKIPDGKLFKYISCPNHAGEMLQWIGFAVLTWSLPAVSFSIWTIANIFPRSISNHKWYLANFEDYPKDRKVVIPFIL